jgi:predicted glycosyltransferase
LVEHAPRIAFYVQHLLGIGHLYRARRLCDALHEMGADVTLISGGVPARALEDASFEIVQLPAIRSGDAGFSGLVDENGKEIDDAFKAQRKDGLLSAIERLQPHAIITEAFPFGRRQVRFELMPLLDKIAALPLGTRPILVASIRDLLQEGRKPGRDDETVDILNRHYDAVLVHGDPAISTLSDTFQSSSAITIPVHDTGLVAPPAPRPDSEPRFDVIVSVGGGAVGEKVLMAAASAAAEGLLDGSVALITGPNAPDDLAAALEHTSAGCATVLPYISDLCGALVSAQLSISQAGYNTVADILVAGSASVLVPFAAGGETEQTRRAEALHAAGRAVMLHENDITPQALAAAAQAAMNQQSKALPVSLAGAQTSARIVLDLIRNRTAAAPGNITGPD